MGFEPAGDLSGRQHVLKWMSLDIKGRPGLGIADVGQEKQYADQKRSDLVVWIDRDVESLAAIELKTLTTPLADPAFQNDVIKKARRVGATVASAEATSVTSVSLEFISADIRKIVGRDRRTRRGRFALRTVCRAGVELRESAR